MTQALAKDSGGKAEANEIEQISWMDNWLPYLLREEIIPLNVRSVVDVGCGRGIAGAMLRCFRDLDRLVGIDIFEPYFDRCLKVGYTSVIKHDLQLTFRLEKQSDSEIQAIHVEPLTSLFKEGEFDLALCLETIEHLTESAGEDTLERLKKIANMVIVSTPATFFTQGMKNPLDGNIYQRHSSWHSAELIRSHGYRILHAVAFSGNDGTKVVAITPSRYVKKLVEVVGTRKLGRKSARWTTTIGIWTK